MKYKKYSYIIALILMLFIGIKPTFAASKMCYYMEPEGSEKKIRAQVQLNWGYHVEKEWKWSGIIWTKELVIWHAGKIRIDNVGGLLGEGDIPILNWGNFFTHGSGKDCGIAESNGSDDCTTAGLCFGFKYNSHSEFENASEPECPKYIVIERNYDYGNENWGWITDDITKAQKASNTKSDMASWFYASNYTLQGGQEVQITKDMYDSRWVGDTKVEIDDTQLDCSAFFTSDIKDLINEILEIPRIIIPIVVILFGIIDFAKATIASKEDAMKKAQSDFVKRIVIGVAIFFVPTLVDLVMELANIVWEGLGYSSCKIV